MGQKTHPYGFRLGYNNTWRSRWYAEGQNYADLLHEDLQLRQELYRRLKERNVLVIPGEYFFYGIEQEDWQHRNECIRVSYAMDEVVVREGLRIIAEEVKACLQPA